MYRVFRREAARLLFYVCFGRTARHRSQTLICRADPKGWPIALLVERIETETNSIIRLN